MLEFCGEKEWESVEYYVVRDLVEMAVCDFCYERVTPAKKSRGYKNFFEGEP